MFRIFGYLKPYILQILLVTVLLIVQALCDLSLPQYTSDIVDIGIQQGGITDAVPSAISEESFNTLSLFLDDAQKELFLENYTLKTDDMVSVEDIKSYPECRNMNVYFLNDVSEETRGALDTALASSMMMVYNLETISFEDFSSDVSIKGNIPEGVTSFEQLASILGVEYEGDINLAVIFTEMNETLTAEFIPAIKSAFENMPESIISQGAVAYVKNVYEKLGADTGAIQSDYLLSKGAVMIAITFIMMIVSITAGYISSVVAGGVGYRLRGRVFKKVVSFSNAEIEKFSTASLITRSTNDIQQIQMVIVMILRMVMYAPILGIGGIVKVLSSKTDMAWIIALAVVAILCAVIVLMSVAMPKFKKMQKLVDRLNLVTREILTGIPVIRAFSREKYEEKRFDAANRDLTDTMLFTTRTMSFMMPIMMLIMNLVTVLIIWIGAGLISEGNIQVGDMMAFITYTMQIVMSFLMLTMISVMLPRAAVSAERINEVLASKPTVNDAASPVVLDKNSCRGEIVFENVSFHYPDADEDVITDVSFTAKAGQTTAIIGSTGSGKSTLVHLIPRFYDVTEGRITIDGTDIRELSQKSLRDIIGFVPQKGVLFSGTIESNLKFGNQNASMDELNKAAQISQSAEFIDKKPDKFSEPVSQGGTNVSGGQKQRLSIARAIVRKPKIYIFDDSFSALDFKTDAALRKALSENTSDSTVIIVAQRISTILNSDKIIVLDEGRIVGTGTHSELMRECEVYRQIAVSQLSATDLERIENDNREEGDNNE